MKQWYFIPRPRAPVCLNYYFLVTPDYSFEMHVSATLLIKKKKCCCLCDML